MLRRAHLSPFPLEVHLKSFRSLSIIFVEEDAACSNINPEHTTFRNHIIIIIIYIRTSRTQHNNNILLYVFSLFFINNSFDKNDKRLLRKRGTKRGYFDLEIS
jgi:hypothetical protein